MEKDNEIKGQGNSYDFGARLYDPRVGRWLSRDALEGKKPYLSPYQAFKNSPLIFNDPDGKDEYLTIVIDDKRTGRKTTIEVEKAISTKIRTDWKEKNGGTSIASYDYYDYRTTITMTIDEEGKKSIDTQYKIMYENGVKDNDFVGSNYSPKPKPDLMYTLFNSNLECEGGSQKGGLRLTTEDGEVSRTKYIAENDVKSVNIDAIRAAFGAKGKSLAKPSEVEEGVEIISELYKEVAGLTTGNGGSDKTGGGSMATGEGNTETGLGGTPNESVNADKDTTITIYTFEQHGGYSITHEKKKTVKKSEIKN